MLTIEEIRKQVTAQEQGKRYAPWRLSERFQFMKGVSSIGKYNDPTYLGFVLLFDFDTSPLLGSEDTMGTAANWLKRTNQIARLSYLKAFINSLRLINQKMPWYWQSIEGGTDLWKWKGMKDPYRGGDDAKISITCLESIDLIVTMMMDLYRKAVYDFEYRRVVIPDNLRKFTVTVHIEEVRMFQFQNLTPLAREALTQFNNRNPSDFSSKLLDKESTYMDGNTPYVTFTLTYCEFLEDESGVAFDTLNMGAPEMAKQKLVWKFENIIETENYYPEFGKVNGQNLDIIDRQFNTDDRGEWEKLNEQFLQNTVVNSLNRAESLTTALGQRVLLGNVYGLNQTNVTSALQQGSILSLGPAAVNSVNNTANLFNNSSNTTAGNLGNVFD